MGGVDVWPVVHSERKALAVDLAPLTEEKWSTQSLCPQWTVRQVVAHMSGTAQITPATFLPKLIGSGFSFERLQAKGIAANLGTSGADTLSHFEAIVASKKRRRGRRTPSWARRSSTPRTSGGLWASRTSTRPTPWSSWPTSSRART